MRRNNTALGIVLALTFGAVMFAFGTASASKPAAIATSTEGFSIKSKDGKHSLNISAWEDGVGLFLSGPNGKSHVTIVSSRAQGAYVGLNDGSSKGCPIALGINDAGEAGVQIVGDDGKAIWVTTEQLKKLAK